MKHSRIVFSVVLFLCHYCQAAVNLPSYEGFDYPAGTDLGAATTNTVYGFRWTHTGTTLFTPTINVTNDNLSYPGLAVSVGNAIAPTATPSQGLRYAAGGQVDTPKILPIYYSVLLKINSLGTLNTSGVSLFSFNNTTNLEQTSNPSTLPARLTVRLSTNAGKFNLGLETGYGTGSPAPTWFSTDFSPGATVFGVVKYSYISGSAATGELWVNPDPATMGSDPAPPSNLTNNLGTQFDVVQSLLVINTAANYPAYTADEIRVGTNFAAVAPAGPPGFTTPLPANQSVNYGASIVLNPGAAGPGTLTYQWSLNNTPLSDGGGFTGSSAAALTISGATASQAGTYTLAATGNPYGSATSSPSVLAVTDPVITNQPAALTLPPAADAVFRVGAAGSGTVTYQWKKGGANLSNGASGSGSTIIGATASGLTVHNISGADVDTYSVLVSGAGAPVLSGDATLTVIDPAITSNPTNVTVNYNASATFKVTAVGTGPFTYQWQLGGTNLTDTLKYPGCTSSGLTVANAAFADDGSYRVVVANHLSATATSSPAVLTVNDPFFLSSPTSQIIRSGLATTLSAAVSGSGALTYQWKKTTNNVAVTLADGGNITGATTTTLSLNNLTTNDTGSYFLEVTGGQTVDSSNGVLTVMDVPVIAAGLQSRVALAGDRVVFIGAASGTGPFTYSWTKNGGSPLAGATANALVLTNVSAADAGTYALTVSSGVGAATSSATLAVLASPAKLSQNNLVVVRVGDGAQTLSTFGNSVYLDHFTTAGVYVNTTALPDSGTNGFLMTGGGSSFTDCHVTRSADGKLLCLAGYATNLNNTLNMQGVSAALVPRAIYTVDGNSSGVMARSANVFGTFVFRSACTDGADNFWGSAGQGGTVLIGNGLNQTIQNTVTNTRVVNIFNGELYFSSAQGALQSLWKFPGTPPTTFSGPTELFPISNGTGLPSPLAFSVSPDGLTIYIADDRSNGSGGISRYDEDTNSSTWALTYVLGTGVATNIGARGLTVDWSGPNHVVYATTAETNFNRLIAIADTGASAPATTLATSGVNQLFHSVVFDPSPNGVTLSAQVANNQITLQWVDPSSTYVLSYKTNLTDATWTDVGISPTVNNGTSSVAVSMAFSTMFFELHK